MFHTKLTWSSKHTVVFSIMSPLSLLKVPTNSLTNTVHGTMLRQGRRVTRHHSSSSTWLPKLKLNLDVIVMLK